MTAKPHILIELDVWLRGADSPLHFEADLSRDTVVTGDRYLEIRRFVSAELMDETLITLADVSVLTTTQRTVQDAPRSEAWLSTEGPA